ncbi:MAG: ribosomal protein S18-alanine N-acetyltransferase [Alicyclobacillus sp.]|nr:ribosomal protein S18-alanine N-acetyltransferase [Alicyclobacillus sp.]
MDPTPVFESERTTIRRMTLRDIDQVLEVEHLCFTAPWSRQAFVTELVDNRLAEYLVLEHDHRVIGYIGVWLVIDEGHITNVAVHPDFRGQHLGEFLMRTVMDNCAARGMRRITLEVRVTNTVAQNLYRKLGFVAVGKRRGYYTDNNEDAIIMWADLPAHGGQEA